MKKTHLTPPNEMGLQNFVDWRLDDVMKYHEMFKHHPVNFQLPKTPKGLKISCSQFFKDHPIPPSMKENIVDMELINKVSGINREVYGDVDMIEIDRISGIKHKPSSPPPKEIPMRPEINKSCEDMLEKIFEELSERDKDKKSVSSESDNLSIKTVETLEDEHKDTQEEESVNLRKNFGKKSMAPSISKKSIHTSPSGMQTGSHTRKDGTTKSKKIEESEFRDEFSNKNSLASFISQKSMQQTQSGLQISSLSGNDETFVPLKIEESGNIRKWPSEDSVASSISEKATLTSMIGMQAYSPVSTSSSKTDKSKSSQSTPSGMKTHSRAGNDATSMTEKTASFDQETQTEIPSSCKKGIKSFCKKLFKKGGKSKKSSS